MHILYFAGEYPNVAWGEVYHFTRESAGEYPNVAWGKVSIGEKALVKVLFYEICGTFGFLFRNRYFLSCFSVFFP